MASSAAPVQPAPDGLPTPRRYWAIATVGLGVSISVLDSAIANVSLPTIARDLGASPGSTVWVVNAYQLGIVVCLLPFAALGERLGYRRVYLTGLCVFALGSLGCALSHTLWQLIAARALQGLGAGCLMSNSSALTRFNYPASMLGRGIALNAVIISLSAASGPTLASLILLVAPWNWLFGVNIPLIVLAVIIGLRALPFTPPSPRRFDILSALLNAVAFGGIILGAETLVREGAGQGLPLLLVGAAAAIVLARRELGRPSPLVPFDLMRIPIFSLSIATSFVSFAAQMLTIVALPFYLQVAMGRSVVESGLLITPWPLAVALAAPLAGRLADKVAAGALCGAGLIVFAVGLLLLAQVRPGDGNADILWRMAICGLGFGFFQSPNNRTIVSSAPRERSGAAGGMLASGRLLGQTTGAVTMAAFFHIGGVEAAPSGLLLASAIAALAAVVSFSRLRIRHPPVDRPDPPPADGG